MRQPVDGEVRLPGSKSLTNRWLVLAALGERTVRIRGALRSRDTALMVTGLRQLGTAVDDAGDEWVVRPTALRGPADIDCGLAGTVMRFLLPVAALAQGAVRLDGDERARARPLGRLTRALRELGAQVDGDALPLRVHGQGRLDGGHVRLDASASSQLLSALLLAAPRYARGVEVALAGAVPSEPHVAMTVACLRAAGAVVDDDVPGRYAVAPGPLHLADVTVEPDLSNAAPFLAAALVTGGRVRVPYWPATTDQAGDALRGLLTRMGGEVVRVGDGLEVRGTGRVLGLDADLGAVGELLPVVAALAALADTPSTLTGVAHVRHHETDRLAALTRELSAVGSRVEELPDGLRIQPAPLRAAALRAYADHRMATAAAVIGLRVPGVSVDDVGCTAKTLPDFVGMWHGLVGER